MNVRRKTIEMGQALNARLERMRRMESGPSATWNQAAAYAALHAGRSTAEEIRAYCETMEVMMSTRQIAYYLSRDPNVQFTRGERGKHPGHYRLKISQSP